MSPNPADANSAQTSSADTQLQNLYENPLASLAVASTPFFVDTYSCRCALQRYNGAHSAWRCTGSNNPDPYDGVGGKYYPIADPNKDKSIDPAQLDIWDASLPPNTETAYWGAGLELMVKLSVWDGKDNSTVDDHAQVCTGKNDTDLTTRAYTFINASGTVTTMDQLKAAPCIIPLPGMPLGMGEDENKPLPDLTTRWKQEGCKAGFFCPKNSINALPEICHPVPACQEARLAGQQCPQMGIFEPVLCPQGVYCPSARENYTCPAGSYCPPGSMQPLPCTGAASCPAGSYYNQPIVPIILLVLWNVACVAAFVFFRSVRMKKLHRNQSKDTMMARLRKANPKSYMQPAAARKRAASNASDISDDEYELEANVRSFRTDDGHLTAETEYYGALNAPTDKQSKPGELEAFVASLSRCIQGSSFGLSFTFRGLVYQPKKVSKPILRNVTGQIKSGTLVGVMGGSGAGKSTFVNVLMGKRPHTQGETKINGVAGNIKAYKKIIGYVPQDDILLTELTVRENILHSARIRLPSTWSDADIQHHVDVLLQCLALDHVKDNIVGGAGSPGVSGGQRKRVSIGMELAAAPMALFLDEPTSGLDATAASSIMELLKALSRLGITVVTIIHQPRQEIYESLDDLILLGKGCMLYCDSTSNCVPYLESCGFSFPRHQNPADVIMDIINGEGRHYKKAGEISVEALINNWQNKTSGLPPVPTVMAPQGEVSALKRSIKQRGATMPKQLYLCLSRAMLQQYRAASSFWFEIGVATVAGALIGLAENAQHGLNFRGLYYDDYAILSSSADVNSIGQMAMLCVIAIGLVASSPGVKVFGEERLVYYREAASGHNRFAYYLGKAFSALPRTFIAATHFTTMFMLLASPRMAWMEAFAIIFLYYYCIYGLASCVSMAARREDGPLLAVMASLIAGTLSGMAPTLANVASWHMTWLWRASPGAWAGEAMFDTNVSPWKNVYNVQQMSEYVGYNLGAFHLDVAVLFGIGTAYRVLAFVLMRFLNRSQQR